MNEKRILIKVNEEKFDNLKLLVFKLYIKILDVFHNVLLMWIENIIIICILKNEVFYLLLLNPQFLLSSYIQENLYFINLNLIIHPIINNFQILMLIRNSTYYHMNFTKFAKLLQNQLKINQLFFIYIQLIFPFYPLHYYLF